MVKSNDAQFGQQQKRVVLYRERSGRVPVVEIEDLEESAYEGDSFGILAHIAEVLGRDLELCIITILPEKYVEPEQQQELAARASRQPAESDSVHVGD